MKVEQRIFNTIEAATDVIFNPTPSASDVIAERDIVYDESDPATCVMDTYHLPRESGAYPVVMYIHGGGFVSGDKRHRRGVSVWYASQGAYVFNVNYGLCPAYAFPQPLLHLIKAIDYIAENADKLHLDLTKFVLSGDSAGGYYAAMLIATRCNEYVASKIGMRPRVPFAGAILNCGLYDARAALDRKLPLDLPGRIYRAFCGDCDESSFQYSDVISPIDYVTPDFPPSYLIYSEKDVLCKGQAEALIARLAPNGVYYEYFRSRRFVDNHCFPLAWKSRSARKANAGAADFFSRLISSSLTAR